MARSIIKKVPLDKVVWDREVYPRENVNWQTAYDYANSLNAGAKFPPITLALNSGKLILVDGKHRLDAHKQVKAEEIEAEVFTGWSRKEIFIESIKRNITHGKMFSPYEKRKAILRLRELKLGAGAISKLIQIPMDKMENFVARRMINTITGEGIVPRIVKSEIRHKAGSTYEEAESDNIMEAQRSLYTISQIDLFNHLINLFENGLIDLENKKILNRIKRLSELLVLKVKE